MLNEEQTVLDHGFVRLDGVLADDLSVVNSARVSLGKRSELEKVSLRQPGSSPSEYQGFEERLKKADVGLINFLLRERHGTPFEHNAFRFHVKAPLFVFREWQRHRIASYNEMSGRYVQFKNPDFYVPDSFRQRVEGSKPGAYQFEKWQGNGKQAEALFARHNQDSLDIYEWAIQNGMATEHARLVLPVSLYSEMYWTTNARSMMNFLSLRNEEQALWEIRQYAQVVESIFGYYMPVTAEAFRGGNRIAP